MSNSFKEIESSALKLNKLQRTKLAHSLLNSLEIDGDVDQAWIQEVRRRKREIESGAVESIPFETVISEARRLITK